MTPKERAREIARLLNAWADGKTLRQLFQSGEWKDYVSAKTPVINNPSFWRIEPGQSTVWLATSEGLGPEIAHVVDTEEKAEKWRRRGHKVKKWQEVTE